MARIARVVAPGYPHHVTQRGCRRQQTFFTDQDYQRYLDLLQGAKAKAGVAVWAYCLMPNHVHLVVVPGTEQGLSKFLAQPHRQYAMEINRRKCWKGHLWQERFHSYVMSECHLHAAVRYIELNPVRARLCISAYDWKWSSAAAHLGGQDDGIVDVHPMLERIDDWEQYLSSRETEISNEIIRKHSRSGRPAGDEKFIGALELLTQRRLQKLKPGPKPAELS